MYPTPYVSSMHIQRHIHAGAGGGRWCSWQQTPCAPASQQVASPWTSLRPLRLPHNWSTSPWTYLTGYGPLDLSPGALSPGGTSGGQAKSGEVQARSGEVQAGSGGQERSRGQARAGEVEVSLAGLSADDELCAFVMEMLAGPDPASAAPR